MLCLPGTVMTGRHAIAPCSEQISFEICSENLVVLEVAAIAFGDGNEIIVQADAEKAFDFLTAFELCYKLRLD